MNFSNRLRKEIASAQRVAHLTDQWFSVLFVEESLCHSVCRSFCNWNSIAFWMQVSASLLLSGQSSVKDIKHPSGNYSLASENASKLCLIITRDALVWPNRLRRKITRVFFDIGCVEWITEVILSACTKCSKLATMPADKVIRPVKAIFYINYEIQFFSTSKRASRWLNRYAISVGYFYNKYTFF